MGSGDLKLAEEAEPADGIDESDAEVVWEIATKSFLCSPESSSPKQVPAAGAVAPSVTFKDLPAYHYLEAQGLTDIPNLQGCGLAIHSTISCWQIRYPVPAGRKASCARSFGHLKKGYKSSCKALLQCLLWVWKTHLLQNPHCKYSKSRVSDLEMAIADDLGKDIV